MSVRQWWQALWALVAALGLYDVCILLTTGVTTSASAEIYHYFMFMAHTDSWAHMVRALNQLRDHPDVLVYAKLFFHDHRKFQYPPSSLLIPDLLQRITNGSWQDVIAILNGISWLCVPATGYVSWRLFLIGRTRSGVTDEGTRHDRLILLGAFIALALSFFPLTHSFWLGQVQTSMTLLAVLALLAWEKKLSGLAGLCIGLCCTIKPQWGLLVLWAGLRREWTFVAVACASAGVIALIAGFLYGFENYSDYVSVLTYMSQHGENFYPNQTVNGLVNRLLYNGDDLRWLGDAYAPYNPIVYYATAISAMIIIMPALLVRRHEKPHAFDLALMMLAATLASPIAWEHHFAFLLGVFAMLAPVIVRKPMRRWSIVFLVAAFFFASRRLAFTDDLSGTPFNFLESYLFFAALAVMAMLYVVILRNPATRTSSDAAISGLEQAAAAGRPH